ncbi:hypothetical protein AB0910_25250 [Streptomyces sp. NPDC047002]|uniref:hypothetical protein n=1 Tax=Streptomyces sp. NPDC047002 TaxID=3155475 RepID=UPI0034564563
MDPIGLTLTALSLGLRAAVGWPYGAAGVLGVLLLLWGARAGRRSAAGTGAVLLVLVMVAHGA